MQMIGIRRVWYFSRTFGTLNYEICIQIGNLVVAWKDKEIRKFKFVASFHCLGSIFYIFYVWYIYFQIIVLTGLLLLRVPGLP